LKGGVCISRYNSEVLGVLKEEVVSFYKFIKNKKKKNSVKTVEAHIIKTFKLLRNKVI
jgi:hypothetical protein